MPSVDQQEGNKHLRYYEEFFIRLDYSVAFIERYTRAFAEQCQKRGETVDGVLRLV